MELLFGGIIIVGVRCMWLRLKRSIRSNRPFDTVFRAFVAEILGTNLFGFTLTVHQLLLFLLVQNLRHCSFFVAILFEVGD